MIDDREGDLPRPPTSSASIEWIHREFCKRLPESLLAMENPDSGERIPVVPGQLRSRPELAPEIPRSLDHFKRNCFQHGSRSIASAEFGQYFGYIVFDGAVRQEQSSRNFLVGVAAG